MKKIFLILLLVFTYNCFSQTYIEKPEFKKYFEEFGVKGSFVLFDSHLNQYYCYNKEQLDSGFPPASTFKIFNSLVGIETGIIPDENHVIKWDSVKRSFESWNKDQDLKSAYKNSAYWYYQELARRVGEEKMKYFINKTEYGNKNINGGLDQFWLKGELRITPLQQINFLRNLYENKLPFSERSISIVKNIMIEEDTLAYVLRAKTGWANEASQDIGWYVGYIEKANHVYFFAICVQCADKNNNDFAKSRKLITRKILSTLGVISVL